MNPSVYCPESIEDRIYHKPVLKVFYLPDNIDNKSMTRSSSSNVVYLEESYNKLMTGLTQELSSVRTMPFFASIAAHRYVGTESQQRQIQAIYGELVNFFQFFHVKDINLLKMFPVHTYVYGEGTIGIEWNLNKMVIAFDIESSPEDSCWTISSVQSAGNYNEGGYFSKTNSIESVVQDLSYRVFQQLDHLL